MGEERADPPASVASIEPSQIGEMADVDESLGMDLTGLQLNHDVGSPGEDGGGVPQFCQRGQRVVDGEGRNEARHGVCGESRHRPDLITSVVEAGRNRWLIRSAQEAR